MAMSKDSMADKVVSKLAVINPAILTDPQYLVMWKAITEGIIEEITTNMEVLTVVSVPGAASGPTTLAGTGQDTSIL